MGSAFKQTFTKPLPSGAEVLELRGQRFACWTDRRGRKRKERVTVGRDGSLRLLLVSRTHVIKYRDGSGIIRKEGTGCRDRRAAESLLADRHARAELVKANVISPKQAAVSDHARSTNVEHLESYVLHLRAKGASAGRIPQVKARLKRLFTECGFSRLADITPDKLTEWLVLQKGLGMSAATRNGYRVDAVCFCNWCRRTQRMEANPLLDLPTASVNADRRHIRRALSGEEVQRLITTAAIRTVAEYGRDRSKPNLSLGRLSGPTGPTRRSRLRTSRPHFAPGRQLYRIVPNCCISFAAKGGRER